MKRTAPLVGLLLAVLVWGPAPTFGSASRGALAIDWGSIIRALTAVFDAWKGWPVAGSVPGTAGPTPTRRPAEGDSATRDATPAPTGTATRTFTAPPTLTRTPPPTSTRTPRPTGTPTATRAPAPSPASADGQIALDSAPGLAPAQRLASALVVFPYIVSEGTEDTRIVLVNLSASDQTLQCFYVRQADCVEIGFLVTLTAEQPLSWLASTGTRNAMTFTAVPPFDGIGELKCAVTPRRPDLAAHNVLQGRAIVFDTANGETAGYSAIGFQRLVPGDFSGVVDLDGSLYEQCPDRLHFQVLAAQGGVGSELVLVPCTQDLLTQTPATTVVQLAIVNEFEQVLSASFSFGCHTRRSFSRIRGLSKAVLGTDTAHLVVRGVGSPVVGLVIDRFQALGALQTTSNDPFLEGGRSARVVFP